jgi:hypothetical protein
VRGICFDESDPHLLKRGSKVFRIRKEMADDDSYNPRYFVTSERNAHTTYLSKLAARINEETDGKRASRLARIYRAVHVDEVQDLTGWDFQIIEACRPVLRRKTSAKLRQSPPDTAPLRRG